MAVFGILCWCIVGCLHSDRRFVNDAWTVVTLPEVNTAVSVVFAEAFVVPRWTLDEWPESRIAACVQDEGLAASTWIPMDYALLEITDQEIRFLGERVVSLTAAGTIDPALVHSRVLIPLEKKVQTVVARLQSLKDKGLHCLKPGVSEYSVFDGNVLVAIEEGVPKETYLTALLTVMNGGFEQPHLWVTNDASKTQILRPDLLVHVLAYPGFTSNIHFEGHQKSLLANVHKESIVMGPRSEWHNAQTYLCDASSCDGLDKIPRHHMKYSIGKLGKERPYIEQVMVCLADGTSYAGLLGTLESLYPYTKRLRASDESGLKENWLQVSLCPSPPINDASIRESLDRAQIKRPSFAELLGVADEPVSVLGNASKVALQFEWRGAPMDESILSGTVKSLRKPIQSCVHLHKQLRGSATLSWKYPAKRWAHPEDIRLLQTSVGDLAFNRCLTHAVLDNSYVKEPGKNAGKEVSVALLWAPSVP